MTEPLPTHVESLLVAILLNRAEPLAPHHVGALRELLEYPTDDELRTAVIKRARTALDQTELTRALNGDKENARHFLYEVGFIDKEGNLRPPYCSEEP